MRIISYSSGGERDYGFLVSHEQFIPRYFVEDALRIDLPKSVKDLLPDEELLDLVNSVVGKIPIESLSIEGVHLEPPIP
ncbi:MAG TPA: hypothetical protein ENG52_00295, partial [Nitrososphaeria archaeon]|nr:hypothetical protein [Nitrososphaeria archaeon]